MEIIYYYRNHQYDSLYRNRNRTIHPSNPSLLMDTIPYSRPPPHSISAHPVLKNNPLMMQQQTLTPCFEHALNGSTCNCHPLSYGYQTVKIVPEICFKKTLPTPQILQLSRITVSFHSTKTVHIPTSIPIRKTAIYCKYQNPSE